MSRGQLRPDRGRGTSLVDSGKRRQEAQRSTGGSTPRVFYNGKVEVRLEYSITATEAVWLEQSAPLEEPSLRRERWGGRGDQSRVTRLLSRTLALTLIEVQNQWRVNALDDITQRFSMFFTYFSNVLATLINYEKVHYVRLPIAKYC